MLTLSSVIFGFEGQWNVLILEISPEIIGKLIQYCGEMYLEALMIMIETLNDFSPDPLYPHGQVVAVYEIVGGEGGGGDPQPGEGGRHVSAGDQVAHRDAEPLQRGQVQQHVAQVGVEGVQVRQVRVVNT